MSAPSRCPHCHAQLQLLPDGGMPQLCPYCGDALPADVGPSLARLLRAEAASAQPDTDVHPNAESVAAAARPTQEHDLAADNGADITVPEAARTAAPVIEPETTRQASTDTEAPDTAVIELADDGASSTTSEAVDVSEGMEDASLAGAAHAETRAPETGVHRSGERADGSPVPSFLDHGHGTTRTGVPIWQWAAAACLIVLLGLQLIYVQRDALAAQAQWRPWVSRLCGLTGCTVAPWRELAAFRMLGRDVRAVAGRDGVLQVQATFRNDAVWPQPLPNLRVSLSDADGRVLGARVLRPTDYLSSGDPNALVAPGQSVQATALLGEPEAPSVAFAFEFR